MALVVVLNGTIILEQPANSLLEYYPRFRDFLQQLLSCGGPSAATCLMFELSSGFGYVIGVPYM